MAGAKIRGITLEIGGDTSGLSKALKEVNSNVKDTQKQLKDVDRLLKLDPTNTELLAQKQQLLAENVTNTNQKLEELKRIQETMDQNGVDKNSDQYMALQREIIATEADLKKAKSEAKQFAGVKLEAIKAQLDQVGKAAQDVANKTRGISLAAGGALAGLGGLMYKSVQTADELNTLSKQTGFSTTELQKFSFASDLVDVSMDDITSASKKLRKAMGSDSDAFEELGVKTRKSNGELRDMNDVFYETLTALSKVENEVERDNLAYEIFGKNADELAGIIDDGGKALRDWGNYAEEAGLIMDESLVNTLNDTNDKIDTLKNTALVTLTELGAKLLEELMPTLEILFEKVNKFIEWVGSLDGETLELIATLLLLVAALSPVASGIYAVTTALSFLLAHPIVALVAAIVALVALIAIKGDEIQAKLGELDTYLTGIFTKDWTETFGPVLGTVMNDFMLTMQGVWEDVKNVLDGIIDFIRGVFTGDWERVWTGVKEIYEGLFGNMIRIAKDAINSIVGWINSGIDSLNNLISLANSVLGLFGGGGIGSIGHIPFMASGGVLTSGSAIVGEAGAELLTVNQGKATVTPLTNGGGNGAPINITVKSVLDGRIVGESTYRYIQGRNRAYGNT